MVCSGVPSLAHVQGTVCARSHDTKLYLILISEAEARRTLAYYHADGDEQDPLIEFEMEEIATAVRLDLEVSKNVSWVSLFKTPGNRRRMRIIIALAFFSQWSGNGLVSYYLNKVFDDINSAWLPSQTADVLTPRRSY